MKNIVFASIFTLVSALAFSQTRDLGIPVSYSSKIQSVQTGIQLPPVNNLEQKSFYEAKARQSGEKILQYGFPHEVEIDYFKSAEKQSLPNGKNLYQLMIESKNAISINVIFNEFYLQEGTVMYLFSADKSSFIGAYTSLNNNKANKLGTNLLYADKIIIEIVEPKENENQSKLVLGRVIHGFINLDEEMDKNLNSSGNCNIDVNCPQGSGWEAQRNSVVMLVNGGGGFCSGAMVNNTSGIEKAYLLTANHCGSDPSNWTFLFRWESSGQLNCGLSAGSENGPEDMTINGGTTVSKYAPSDFHLIELNSLPLQQWDVVYSGWNRDSIPATSGAGIHHPSGDIKKISISNSDYESVIYNFNSTTADHWKTYWADGVTEGGSSGSPLFDQNKRIVGQLHGGASGCSSTDQSDFYGKFFSSWEGGGSPSTRLRDWLDPTGGDLLTMDASSITSFDPFLTNKIIGVNQLSCTNTIQTKVILRNGGTEILTSAKIRFAIGNQVDTIDWSGNLGLNDSDTLEFLFTNLSQGQQQLSFSIVSANAGAVDPITNNNMVSSSFYVVNNGADFNLKLNFDCYADETSWKIIDDNNQLVLSKANYINENNSPYSLSESICLGSGCFKLKIYDSFGDGMSYSNCSTVGSIFLTNGENDTLVSLDQSEAAFGDSIIKTFCINLGNASVQELNASLADIYPNPFNDVFYVVSKEPIRELVIYDISGKKVQEIILEKPALKHEIAVDLLKGIYYIQLITNDKIINKKLIKS